MPAVVELSQCIVIGGWGCPISSSVSQKIVACLQLRNNALSSASVVDATTHLKIAHNVKNASFNLMGFVGHFLLCALASDKYDATE
jgi:hypothetical protein